MNDPRVTRQAADDLCRYCFATYARDGSVNLDTVLATVLATCRNPTSMTEVPSIPGVEVASYAGLELYLRTTSDTVELLRVLGSSGPFPPIPGFPAD
jgi:hypothetical protein